MRVQAGSIETKEPKQAPPKTPTHPNKKIRELPISNIYQIED
jgi:hypothetical protein